MTRYKCGERSPDEQCRDVAPEQSTCEGEAGLARRIEEMNQGFDQQELAAIGRWITGVIEALKVETERLESEDR